jgi:hypothetical protein
MKYMIIPIGVALGLWVLSMGSRAEALALEVSDWINKMYGRQP